MLPSDYERLLLRRLLGVLAAVAPMAGILAAGCGDNSQNCTSCFCGAPIPQGPNYDVTYAVCPSPIPDAATADASDDAATADASDDAATDDAATADASDDAAPETGSSLCFSDCMSACQWQRNGSGGVAVCESESGDAGVRVAHCQVNYLCGRRFDGLEEADCGASLGQTLARMAWLEAASIRAFRRLARELRAHGAPEELVAAARACARDESRHARAMARLARAHGAEVPRVEGVAMGVRDLESIARENAVEACVGETYGALLAMWQAERAGDEDVRAAMRAIAPDELRHAALGWAVAEWADTRLEEDARARVAAARASAARDLLQNARVEPTANVARATGAPSARDQARLAAAMRDEVWSAPI